MTLLQKDLTYDQWRRFESSWPVNQVIGSDLVKEAIYPEHAISAD